jgi:hypothetical protein
MEMERITARPVRLVERTDSRIRLAGKNWTILQSQYGVGNWCWNSYRMRIETDSQISVVASSAQTVLVHSSRDKHLRLLESARIYAC